MDVLEGRTDGWVIYRKLVRCFDIEGYVMVFDSCQRKSSSRELRWDTGTAQGILEKNKKRKTQVMFQIKFFLKEGS